MTGLAVVTGAQAADLPIKAPPASPATSCFASFSSWLDSSAADCPLSYMGITVYGQIDVGAGYETNAARFNPAYPNGVSELISKFNNGGRWQWIPNGLTQSNIGIKIKEQIAPDWYMIGDVNAGFDPYSLQFANGPQSLAENNFNTLGNQTANGDSSRTYGWVNSRVYAGISNATLGTLTVGRQYAFTNDAVSNYDPFGGAYAFSLIGTSGTVVQGTGDTELARYNTSVKYLGTYKGFHAGAMYQFGGWEQGNASNGAAQIDVGADYAGFSIDAIYAYAKDAVKLGTYGGSAIPAGDPSDTLQATLANISAGVLFAKYKWNALTLYGGYEYAELSNPSDDYGATPTTNGVFISSLNGGYPAVVQKLAYVTPEDLQVVWIGAKYAVRSDLDVAAGYYYEWQNNYTSQFTSYNIGTSCGPNGGAKGPAIPGATPQGSNSSACAGNTQVVSGMVDWRPYKRLDVYAGVMYSQVAGGMANGFINSNNFAPTAGMRFTF